VEDCRRRIAAALEDCPDGGDDGDCADRAAEAFGTCLDAGGTVEDCRRRIAVALEDCPDGGDDGDCAARAAEAFETCVDAGGSEEDCRRRIAVALEDCPDGGDGRGESVAPERPADDDMEGLCRRWFHAMVELDRRHLDTRTEVEGSRGLEDARSRARSGLEEAEELVTCRVSER
jgi:hypothetical protein